MDWSILKLPVILFSQTLACNLRFINVFLKKYELSNVFAAF